MIQVDRLINVNLLKKAIEEEYDLNYGEILINPRNFYDLVDSQPIVENIEKDLQVKVNDNVFVVTQWSSSSEYEVVSGRIHRLLWKTKLNITVRGKYRNGNFYTGNFVEGSFGKTLFHSFDEAQNRANVLNEKRISN